MFRIAHLASAFLLTSSAVVHAQPPSAASPDWFPFTISALDDLPAALDLSSLNEKPAGRNGFIRPQGENLTDDRGQPWRYFGTNLTASACFPSAEQAPKIAAHFAKTGINLIRFHFLDQNWTGIQLARTDGQPGLNPEALARLDFFFAELKKNGIFANFNLHVGRVYAGTPQGAPDMSKGVDNIYPPFVDALKDYARDLLTHVNPHTGLAYRDDPAVAIVEVNNENTLLMNSFWPAKVTGPVHESVLKQWQEWTGKTYAGDDAKLRAAWGTKQDTPGPNLLTNGTLKDNATGWTLDQAGGASSAFSPAAEGNGIRLTVAKAGTESWHGQIAHPRVPLTAGKTYRLRFRARASDTHHIFTCTQQDSAPYEVAGLWENFQVTPAWQDYRLTFTAKSTDLSNVSLRFGPATATGWFEFADVYLDEYSDGFLPASATLATGIPLPDEKASTAVLRDYYRFLAEKELDYAKEMHRFLKEDLKVKCLVSHSHIFFGALLGVRREGLASDVVNANAYYWHPEFSGGMWDMKNWTISQAVLSKDATGGVLAELAIQRVAGKPFAITEWDVPAPTDSIAESLPILSSYAAWQGWCGLTLYTFAHSDKEYTDDHFHSFFNYQGHPGKRATIPFAALLFRTGAVAPGKERATFTVPAAALLEDIATNRGNIWSNWRRFFQAIGHDGSQALKRQTAITIDEAAPATTVPAMQNASPKDTPAISDHGQITWGSGDGVARVVSPNLLFATGSLSDRTIPLGPYTLKTENLSGDNFAVCGLIPLDGQPLATSSKLLGLALRRAENEGMGWNANRKTVSDQWGRGPSLVLGYRATLSFPEGTSWRVTPLGPDGQPTQKPSAPTNVWSIAPSDRTVWWLIEKAPAKESP